MIIMILLIILINTNEIWGIPSNSILNPFCLGASTLFAIILLYSYSNYRIKKEEYLKKKKEELAEMKLSILNEAIILENKAQLLFKEKKYTLANQIFNDAKNILIKAYKVADAEHNEDLLKAIQENLEICEKNISDCSLAIDKEKVRGYIQDANFYITQSKQYESIGDFTKAQKELNNSNLLLENAFQLASDQAILDGISEIISKMNQIRKELKSIDKQVQSDDRPKEPKAQQIPIDKIKKEEGKIEKRKNGKISINSTGDYKEGFARLNIDILNDNESIIIDVAIRLFFDENYFTIDHIHPNFYKISDHDIIIGIINPKETKNIEILLDPMICQTINIDGELIYRDEKGKLHSVIMNQQVFDIQCPTYTDTDNINTATAINLANRVLKYKDSRVFLIPPKITPEEIFILCKGIIQNREVKHVSDKYSKKGFGAIAFYYGKTKDGEQLVIQIIVLEKSNSIEISVACDRKEMLTGELRNISQEFNEKLMKERIIRRPITQVHIKIINSVLYRSDIKVGEIDKNSSIEIDGSIILRSTIGQETLLTILCPHCGIILDLPKMPKFCPFCTERLVEK